jgi:hypothetical protein
LGAAAGRRDRRPRIAEVLARVTRWGRAGADGPDHLAIEMIASYGMAVGAEVFETCVWIGRLVAAWAGPHTFVHRREVKLHLCGDSRAKDANIRQALIDRYGPGKERAIGKVKAPGPLYGVTADQWSAVAVTWSDRAGTAATTATPVPGAP